MGVSRTRLERLLVAAAYALAVLAYPPSEASSDANTILSLLAIGLVAAIVHAVVARWLHAVPSERRALKPLVIVGPAVLVVAAVTIAHDYVGVSLSDRGNELLDWCALVYTAIPIVFLLGVLRTRLRRAMLAGFLVELSDGTRFDDEALQEAADEARRALRSERPPPNLEPLTTRELEVLALIAEGRTDRGIAEELYVTPKTVEAHVRSIFRKLDLPTGSTQNRRVHAVLTFMRAKTPQT